MADVKVRFLGDTKDIDKDIKNLKRDTQGLGTSAGSAGSSLGAMGQSGVKAGSLIKGALAVGAAKAVTDFALGAVNAATDLEESLNAVQVQFGAGAEKILGFGESAASSVGLANAEFNSLATVTGATLGAFITDADAVADETIKLTQRAVDMASVFNTEVPDAMTALQAAIRGESEPIRKFGVQLDDASVKAKAVAMGLAATTAEVTAQDKGMARLEIIYEQTNKVAGDFANTSDSVANRQRVLSAQWTDAQAAIGEGLLPAFEALITVLEQAMPYLDDFATVTAELVRGGISEWDESMDSLSDQNDRFNQLVAEGADKAVAAAIAYGVVNDELRRSSEATRTAAQAQDLWAASAEGVAYQAGQVAAAVKSQADEVRKATDPAFALRKANEDYRDKLAEVKALQDSGQTSTSGYTEAVSNLLESQADLNYATEKYQEAGQIGVAALFDLAEQANITDEAVQRLIASLGNLNNTPVSIDAQGGIRELASDLARFTNGQQRPL